MADTLESLELEVKHSASGAETEINNVAASIRSLKASLSGVSPQLKALASAVDSVSTAFKGGVDKYNKFAEAMANVAASAELLRDNDGSIKALADAMTAIAGVKVTAGSFNSLANGMQKVGDAAKTITPESIENLDKMVTSLSKLQGVDLQGLGSAMSAVRRGGTSTKADIPVGPVPAELRAIIEASDEVDVLRAKLDALKAALEDAFSTGNADKAYALRGQIIQTEKALERAEEAARKAAEGIDDVGKSAQGATKPLGNFITSLKRIAFYRIVRTIIKEITQALKEGLENAYLWSKEVGGELAPALDRLTSAFGQMKNQLGAALGELLIALEPILLELIHLVTLLAEAFTWLFATLEGKEYYPVANELAKEWKEADDAAKEYKKTILGFDVINRLNDDNSGKGNGTEAKDLYHWEKTGATGAFEWKNISPIFAPLDDWYDGTMKGLGELADTLDSIFGKEYKLDVEMPTNTEYVPVLEKLKQELDLLMEGNPYTVQVGIEAGERFHEKLSDIWEAIKETILGKSPVTVEVGAEEMPGFREVLEGIWQNIYDKVIAPSPVLGQVGWEVQNPVPELVSVGSQIEAEVMKQADAYTKAYEGVQQALNQTVSVNSTSMESMTQATSGMTESVSENLDNLTQHSYLFSNNWNEVFTTLGAFVLAKVLSVKDGIVARLKETKNSIVVFAKESWASFSEWGKNTIQTAETTMERVLESTKSRLENANANILTFISKTGEAFAAWAVNVATSAQSALFSVADSIYNGLQNAANNIVSFVNGTASAIAEWARSGVQNFADWANGVIDSVVSGLKTAWESFKSFMSATGQAISGFWSENKQWIVPVAVGAAITIGAIALAPATGGASLGALAFAANGGVFDEGQMFIAREAGPELVGQVGNKTTVMNNDQIVAAVSTGVANAVASVLVNQNERPLNVRVYLDSREIKIGQQRYNRAMGV